MKTEINLSRLIYEYKILKKNKKMSSLLDEEKDEHTDVPKTIGDYLKVMNTWSKKSRENEYINKRYNSHYSQSKETETTDPILLRAIKNSIQYDTLDKYKGMRRYYDICSFSEEGMNYTDNYQPFSSQQTFMIEFVEGCFQIFRQQQLRIQSLEEQLEKITNNEIDK